MRKLTGGIHPGSAGDRPRRRVRHFAGFTALAIVACGAPSAQAVVNGEEVSQEGRKSAFQSVVSVVSSGKERNECGGVLVNTSQGAEKKTTVVLTAAHCVAEVGSKIALPADKVRVTSGSLEREGSNAVPFGVKSVQIHEQFNPEWTEDRGPENDLALLIVEGVPDEFSPATIDEHFLPPEGTSGSFAGWGLTKLGKVSSKLLSANLRIINSEECEDELYIKMSENTACVGPSLDTLQSASRGDSGGPLLVEQEGVIDAPPKVIALSSWGDVTQEGDPSVFTLLAPYSAWIRSNSHTS